MKNFIFIHIPKTGGTAICHALGIDEVGHFKIDYLKSIYTERWDKAFKFAVVRNPWDRFVSNYEYSRMLVNYWHNNIDPSKAVYGSHSDYEIVKGMTFEEYVDAVYHGKHNLIATGLHHQHQYICQSDKIEIDYVCRFERLQSDFDVVCKLIGIDKVILPKVNVSEREKAHYRDYYNKKTKNMIGEFYRRDVELFHYSFDNKNLFKNVLKFFFE